MSQGKMRFAQTGFIALTLILAAATKGKGEFPEKSWKRTDPASQGLRKDEIEKLSELLGGRGCIVRNGLVVHEWGSQSQRGDWASSAKPVLSTLLMFAVAEGKVKSTDDRISSFGWKLKDKDESMTFAHLANMISGYARPERPGDAWAYNDFAIQLYQKTLFDRVFKEDPNAVAGSRFAALQLEDGLKWEPSRRRLSASVRDFARIAWFWLNRGAWNGRQLIDRTLFDACCRPHVPVQLPQSRDAATDDYLQIGTYGGGSHHFTQAGPGIYGFNWWFNAPVANRAGMRTWPDGPSDAFMSIGARGNCAVVIPSLKIALVAAQANWGDFDPGNRTAPMNQVLRILAEAATPDSPAAHSTQPRVDGEARVWHKLSFSFDGPESSETSEPNPFLDFRMTMVFTKNMKTVVVPGYFAADGRAADTGAEAGNQWRAHFMPDETGRWSYFAFFVRGKDVALDENPNAGMPASFDLAHGVIDVADSDKSAPDLRAAGLLRHIGERYWVFSRNNKPFIKGGADSPENLLAFADFDATKPTHRYEPHAADWRPGDPVWKNDRGKNLVGALNYLAGRGVNCIYFLAMNVKGDGKDVWPWLNPNERERFDVSKLDQWEIVFDHMQKLGIVMHVVHQEQENDQLLDGGDLGRHRRLYYRELIARFSHHPGLEWNLGEEITNTTAQIKAFARFFRRHDPYRHPVVVHTFPSQYEKVYAPLAGDRNIAGASLQVGKMQNCTKVTREWLRRSAEAGQPWAAFIDEIGPAKVGVKPDADDPEHNDVRIHALWLPLMAGGSGAEWLFGYDFPHHDINLEDFRSRDRMWMQTTMATSFFANHLPVRKMRPADDLVIPAGNACLAQAGEVYAVYLPKGGPASIRLPEGSFEIRWYDPRTGQWRAGSKDVVSGPGAIDLGPPPNPPDADWAARLTRTRSKAQPRD